MLPDLPCVVDDVSKDVDFEELARCTDDFNGAQCKAVCVEAVRCSCLLTYCTVMCLQCFDTIGSASRRASGL